RALTAEGAMSLDQDEVALAAGTTVASAAEADSSLPPGHPGRRDYRAQLPVADDPKLSGTNAGGLIRAVERLTQGSAAAVPLTARWEGERIADLLELGERHSAAVLLNLQTGRLWGSRPDPAGVLAFLRASPRTRRRRTGPWATSSPWSAASPARPGSSRWWLTPTRRSAGAGCTCSRSMRSPRRSTATLPGPAGRSWSSAARRSSRSPRTPRGEASRSSPGTTG